MDTASERIGEPLHGSGRGNRVLAVVMPRGETEALRRLLRPSPLRPGDVLLECGSEIERVIFPDSGVVRLSLELDGGGARAGVGLVGAEGVVGMNALLGGWRSPQRAVVQVGGEAREASARALRPLVHGSFAFRNALLRCAAAQLAEAEATAACNALHPLRGRAARWLVTLHDRAGPRLSLTQSSLAEMLGARRPSVNAVLQLFKAEGLVRTARGRLAVADADGLRGVACTCGWWARNTDSGQPGGP